MTYRRKMNRLLDNYKRYRILRKSMTNNANYTERVSNMRRRIMLGTQLL